MRSEPSSLMGPCPARFPSDELSDIDLVVFCTDLQPFDNDAWLEDLGEVWTQEVFGIGRLVVFAGGVKVDFTFKTMTNLRELVASNPLPDQYNMGYEILLDKDGVTADMAKPTYSAFLLTRPDETTFTDATHIFWSEVYNTAKYLKRGDLWHAKLRDWNTKQCLLQMIEWHECAKHHWDYMTGQLGKRMASWVSVSTRNSLRDAFGRFNAEDSWNALFATIRLYQRLSTECADMLGYTYPAEADQNITKYAAKLRQESIQLPDSPEAE